MSWLFAGINEDVICKRIIEGRFTWNGISE